MGLRAFLGRWPASGRSETGDWKPVNLLWPMRFQTGSTCFIERREREDGVIEVRRRDATDDEIWFHAVK